MSVKIIWDKDGKNYESLTHYDIDIAKSGDTRSIWLLKNESNHYSLSKADRRSQVKPITQVCIGDSFTIAIPIFTDTGLLIDPMMKRSIQVQPHEISYIPDPMRQSIDKGKYVQPNLDYILQNFKNMPFYKKDYYHADLSRVCDFEELIIEWCQLDDITNAELTDKTLMQHGFDELVDHYDDFMFIAESFNQ